MVGWCVLVVVWSWWVKVRNDGRWMVVAGEVWVVVNSGWGGGGVWVAIHKFIAKF